MRFQSGHELESTCVCGLTDVVVFPCLADLELPPCLP